MQVWTRQGHETSLNTNVCSDVSPTQPFNRPEACKEHGHCNPKSSKSQTHMANSAPSLKKATDEIQPRALWFRVYGGDQRCLDASGSTWLHLEGHTSCHLARARNCARFAWEFKEVLLPKLPSCLGFRVSALGFFATRLATAMRGKNNATTLEKSAPGLGFRVRSCRVQTLGSYKTAKSINVLI